jgi:hypothetical protein
VGGGECVGDAESEGVDAHEEGNSDVCGVMVNERRGGYASASCKGVFRWERRTSSPGLPTMKWTTTSFGVWVDVDVAVSKGIWGRGSVIRETGEREEGEEGEGWGKGVH